jgi:hypothetical protein
MKAIKGLLCVALALVLSSGALAADEARKEKGGKAAARKAPAPTAQLLKDIELTDAQKEQVAAINKEFAGKQAEIQKKQASILSADQIKAQREVMANAKKAGTKPADVRKEVDAALKLTDEQKTQMAEVRKAQGELRGQMIAALKKVLTEEQAARLPQQRGAAKGKKPAGEKKPNAKKKKPE